MSRLFFTRALCALMLIPFAASAEDAPAEPAAAIALTLEDAATLALTQQPQLQAQADAVRATRESAVAAGQLPDPKLNFGIGDLTLTGPERFTLRKESDTQFQLGVMQEFPRGRQRALRGEKVRNEAAMQQAELEKLQRSLRRDVALNWIEVWKPERERELTRAAAREADLQAQAVEIAYRSGKGTQADVLAARIAVEVLHDRIAALEQEAAHARSMLSRWIGAEADRPLCPDLPDWPAPDTQGALLERLKHHPHLAAAARQVDVASSEVALAEQDYKPGWSVEAGYSYRPNFADYAQLKFSVDLPWFTAQRQDRVLAAKLAELERAQQLADDDWREHAAELRLNYTDWQLLQARFARYDQSILPQAAQRVEAARLAWQSGNGTLAQVLDARRAELDLRMQRLELQADNTKHLAQLRYLAGDGHE